MNKTFIASELKKLLIDMAVNNTLPSDMTQLDETLFIPILEGNTFDASEKEKTIQAIRNIISEWGAFDIPDLDYEVNYPMITRIGKNHEVMAESFGHNVTGLEYINGIETDTHTYEYSELTLDVLQEILEVAKEYDTQCYKIEKRSE